MKIISLVENESKCDVKPVHWLSLYIETNKHKILFDLGPDNTLFENAKKRNIDLTKVDTVIISHGHKDHGGALERFLDINKTAKVYIQRKAFEPHYCKILFAKFNVGLNSKLKSNKNITLLDGDYRIDDELFLFTVQNIKKCYSKNNDTLYDKDGKDKFLHEQNLIISENKNVLIMGCGHTGVVNIMEQCSNYNINYCIGGYHLFNPVTKRTVSKELLKEIANELAKYNHVTFYTCHCTGKNAYKFLSEILHNMNYLQCGETIKI